MALGYGEFLSAYGLTDEIVKGISYRTDDLIEDSIEPFYIYKSLIEGFGLFTSKNIKKFNVLGKARIGKKRTLLGRYVNHSNKPNCIINSDMEAIAIDDILKGCEITYDYSQVLSVNMPAIIDLNKELKEADFLDIIRGFFPTLDFSEYENLQRVEIIEWIMTQVFENVADLLPVREWIHGGMYSRELTIPADTLLTGKIHTLDHAFILSKGKLLILGNDGIKTIEAPYFFTAKAGTKKLGYAYSDCVCTTVNTTQKTDLKEAFEESIKDSDLSWVQKLYNDQGLICQAQE